MSCDHRGFGIDADGCLTGTTLPVVTELNFPLGPPRLLSWRERLFSWPWRPWVRTTQTYLWFPSVRYSEPGEVVEGTELSLWRGPEEPERVQWRPQSDQWRSPNDRADRA